MKKILELLLKSGADPNARSKAGETALTTLVSSAILPELARPIKMVIEAGGKVNDCDGYGFTPLSLILLRVRGEMKIQANDKMVDILNMLLDAGADINEKVDDHSLISIALDRHGDTISDEIMLLYGKHGSRKTIWMMRRHTASWKICFMVDSAEDAPFSYL
jgi:ankyrin repeat protein